MASHTLEKVQLDASVGHPVEQNSQVCLVVLRLPSSIATHRTACDRGRDGSDLKVVGARMQPVSEDPCHHTCPHHEEIDPRPWLRGPALRRPERGALENYLPDGRRWRSRRPSSLFRRLGAEVVVTPGSHTASTTTRDELALAIRPFLRRVAFRA